jgi:hypothetical protein
MPVTTVQDDLLADVERIVIDGPTPGDWRIRPEDPEPRHPVAPERETVKITPWDRLRWWAMFRFSRKARR